MTQCNKVWLKLLLPSHKDVTPFVSEGPPAPCSESHARPHAQRRSGANSSDRRHQTKNDVTLHQLHFSITLHGSHPAVWSGSTCQQYRIHCSVLFVLHDASQFMLEEDYGKNEIEWTERAEIRNIEFSAAVETCKAISWPTPGFTERGFHSSGFSEEGGFNFCGPRFPKVGSNPLLHVNKAHSV